MVFDSTTPFRGSEAVRAGHVTWGALTGPAFRRLGADTYVLAGAHDALQDIRAAAVRAGSTAVVTGWSACRVLGLDVQRGRRPVELAIPDRRLDATPGLITRRQDIPDDEVITRSGLRVTTPLRTAVDLATRSGPVTHDLDPVVDPLCDAVAAADALARVGGFAPADLLACAARRRGARGVRRVPDVSALMDPRADSPPESRMRVRLVLAGLPRPRVRFEIRDERGLLRFELDLAWPEYQVAAEYDGKDHARADRRGRDVDRHDALRHEGWHAVVVTSRQLDRPRWVPDRIEEALVARGWTPDPRLRADWQHITIRSPFRS